jgi:NADPH2:quinone reductase
VFADGPVTGRTVLVTGGAGAVAHYAIELAKHGGARVLATASTPAKQAAALGAGADIVVDYRRADAAEELLRYSGGAGVDRVVDVAFGANLPLTSAVVASNGTIASYGSDAVPEPAFPFYPLMRKGINVRLVSVFALSAPALRAATDHVTRLLADRALTHPIAARHDLADIAAAHQAVERGDGPGKVLLSLE